MKRMQPYARFESLTGRDAHPLHEILRLFPVGPVCLLSLPYYAYMYHAALSK